MNKQQLLIMCDADMNADECTLAKQVITDVCTWLLEQPRQMGVDSCMPMFSEIKYYVGRNRLSKGLRHKRNGTGWQTLRLNQILCINSEPPEYFFDVPYEIALGGSAVYLNNQLFRCEGYSDDDFRAQEHYQMQLKWLEEHSPNVYENVKREAIKRRNAARRNKKPISSTKSSPPTKPKQNHNSWFHPPMNFRQVTTSEPQKEHPKPVMSEDDLRALEIIKGHQRYMKSVCRNENLENLEDK